jgi:WD40 repeat protein
MRRQLVTASLVPLIARLATAKSPIARTLPSGRGMNTHYFPLFPLLCVWLSGWHSSSSNAQEPPPVYAVAFSPDGKLLAAGGGPREGPGALALLDAVSKRLVWTRDEAKGVCALAFAPGSRLLAVAPFDRSARLIDAISGKAAAVVGEHEKENRWVAFSPDGRTLATAGADQTVRFWGVADGAARGALRGHTDTVFTAEFSPDAKTLVSAGGGDAVRLWDLATGKEQQVWRHGGFYNRCAAFAGDSRWVLTGGYEGTVRLWDANNGKLRARFHNMGGVEALAYSPAAHALAVCSHDRDVHLFSLDLREPTDKQVKAIAALLARFEDDSYEAREAAGRDLLAMGFVAEQELARAAKDSPSAEVRMRARRVRQQMLSKPLATLRSRADSILAVAFSPDGKTLATGAKDGTIILWDVPARMESTSMRMPERKD